ncbi:MAG TPA: hypothetical protein VFU36_10520, partial [Jatrophihabitans sp.]|nr:hypothetical protein [Jatrophihabitans sp.]
RPRLGRMLLRRPRLGRTLLGCMSFGAQDGGAMRASGSCGGLAPQFGSPLGGSALGGSPLLDTPVRLGSPVVEEAGRLPAGRTGGPSGEEQHQYGHQCAEDHQPLSSSGSRWSSVPRYRHLGFTVLVPVLIGRAPVHLTW